MLEEWKELIFKEFRTLSGTLQSWYIERNKLVEYFGYFKDEFFLDSADKVLV